MLISIGVLAWNEEDVIETMLVSLFQQSVFHIPSNDLPEAQWEIIVVPNGCSDNTAEVAQRVLAKLVSQADSSKITFCVCELIEPGKSNAWNYFIHEYSSSQADLILMMDADIVFGETKTVSNTIKALLENPQADVAVDLPLKDVVKKHNKTLIERITVAASAVSVAETPAISGQFFCARTNVLRQIWMPKGLAVEDGFLRAMIVTDCFRLPINEGKIIRAQNATHYYETLTSFREIFRHELRIVIGTSVNCYFTWDFLLFATDPSGPGAGVLIRNWIENNPSWYPTFIENSIRNHGYWVLPRGMLFRRFSKFKYYSGLGLIKCTLIVSAGFLLDLPVFFVANRHLKKGSAIGYW